MVTVRHGGTVQLARFGAYQPNALSMPAAITIASRTSPYTTRSNPTDHAGGVHLMTAILSCEARQTASYAIQWAGMMLWMLRESGGFRRTR